MKQTNCPVCKEQKSYVFMQTYDDRYGYQGSFKLMQCQLCGHIFLNCHMSPSELMGLYTKCYPRKNFSVEAYKPHREQRGFSAWLNGLRSSAYRWVPKNVCVLDIGCGFGESLGYHSARGCDVYGVEADENIRRVIKKFGYKVHVGLFDDKLYSENFFDFVTMDQVIEHLTDPIAVLRGVARILKPGGAAILSTPNAHGWGAKLFGKRWINWHAPYHLQFFTCQSMRQAAEVAGLTLVEVNTITNSEWLHYQWVHLATYPIQGKPSCFWSPVKTDTVLTKKVIVKLLSLFHRTKVNHCVTRLFDSLGMGDNFVFVLKKP